MFAWLAFRSRVESSRVVKSQQQIIWFIVGRLSQACQQGLGKVFELLEYEKYLVWWKFFLLKLQEAKELAETRKQGAACRLAGGEKIQSTFQINLRKKIFFWTLLRVFKNLAKIKIDHARTFMNFSIFVFFTDFKILAQLKVSSNPTPATQRHGNSTLAVSKTGKLFKQIEGTSN